MPIVECKVGVAMATPIPYVRSPAGKLVASQVSMPWHRHRMGLVLPTNYNSIEILVEGLEVGDARNQVVDRILAASPRPRYLFFLDYDVLPPADAVKKLIYRAEHFPDHDIFAGVYCCKSIPAEPLIYAGDGHGPFWDWSIGDLLLEGITGVHMGLTLIRVDLFERIERKDGWFKTVHEVETSPEGVPLTHIGTEDLYFCRRAREEAGAKILVDTSVIAGHYDWSNDLVYGLPLDCEPVLRCPWMDTPAKRQQDDSLLKALDIGAGDTRRQWDGHRTWTTDIRADVHPDHVMHSLDLTLPPDFYDLVASSHHFEHFGRWEQERLWAQVFRVTKPGGRIEIVVPNLDWAAATIQDAERGDSDDAYEHALNVLYGAQEAHGYARDLNTHYFGYTARIGKALAEQAGFTDVTTESWREHPEHGYNLIIRGTKPQPSPPSGVMSIRETREAAKAG